MNRTLLRLFALVLALQSCTSAPTASPTRAWRVLADKIPEGAVMSGALLADGTPLLVGGQEKKGAIWLWKEQKLQTLTPPDGRLLAWVSVLGDGTALVVGNGRRAVWRAPDGTFTAEALPDGDELWGCHAISKEEAWAVGGNPLPDNTATPVLVHRTASGWASVALPPLSSPHVRLFKVDGHGANDVLAVGDDGEALHYDGQTWKEESTGTGEKLTTVHALANGRYIAVGGLSTGVARLREADGTWHNLRSTMNSLSGVDAWDDRYWVCGAAGWVESIALDGGSETTVDSLTSDDLHLMLRLPNGDALAGGGNFGAFKTTMHGVLLGWTESL